MNLAKQDVVEAVGLLDHLKARKLTMSNWDHVAVILGSMRDAIDNGDATAFDASVGDLEVLSLESASRTGRQPVSAPEPVTALALSLSLRLKSALRGSPPL